jgi:hypothetical protein
LAEQRVGRGRVLTWASTLDTRWNDLALQPVFLPFVHQLLKYSAGYAANPSSLTVGDPWDPASARVPESFSLALAPTGERLTLDGSAPLTVAEPGFYELRERGSGARGPTLAVNVDRVEGSLEPFAPDELVRALALSPATGTPVAGGDIPIAERERAQSAWWYLVVLAFLLLAAETVLSNRAPRAVAPSRG